jgi:hypothetical protein
VRPYAQRVAGTPLEMAFDYRRRRFFFAFRHDPAVEAPTDIFVPELQYPHGCRVEVSDGHFTLDLAAQRLVYRHTRERPIHRVALEPSDRP